MLTRCRCSGHGRRAVGSMIPAGIIKELWQQVSLTRTPIQHTILGLVTRTIQAVTRAAMVPPAIYDFVEAT
jgi:hypothetical protein